MPRGHFDKSKSAPGAVLISDSFGEVAFRGRGASTGLERRGGWGRPIPVKRNGSRVTSRKGERSSRLFVLRGTVVTTVRLNGNLRRAAQRSTRTDTVSVSTEARRTRVHLAKARLTLCQSAPIGRLPRGSSDKSKSASGGTLAPAL